MIMNHNSKMDDKKRRISQLHENKRLLVGDEGFLNDDGFRFSYSKAPTAPHVNARSIFNEKRDLKNFKEAKKFETHDESHNRNKKKRKRNRSG